MLYPVIYYSKSLYYTSIGQIATFIRLNYDVYNPSVIYLYSNKYNPNINLTSSLGYTHTHIPIIKYTDSSL